MLENDGFVLRYEAILVCTFLTVFGSRSFDGLPYTRHFTLVLLVLLEPVVENTLLRFQNSKNALSEFLKRHIMSKT